MFIVLKKITVVLIAIAIVCAGGAVYCLKSMTKETMAESTVPVDVIIDPGHGEFDGGASGVSGVLEKDLNLAISLKVADLLKQKGVSYIMTRETDATNRDPKASSIRQKKVSDSRNRRELINKSGAKAFVSIHMNTFEESQYRGAQVFYSKNLPESKTFATLMQNNLKSALNDGNSRVAKQAGNEIFLLKSPPMPAILIECGFLTNIEEEALLKTDSYQQKLAEIIVKTVQDWLATQPN